MKASPVACALKGEFLVTNLPRGKIPWDPRIPWGSQGDREGTAALGNFTGFFLFDKSYKGSNDSAEGLLGCSALIINCFLKNLGGPRGTGGLRGTRGSQGT